ncbi:MAG: allophanate hydrolase subunit 1 [Bacteroidota bacterium]
MPPTLQRYGTHGILFKWSEPVSRELLQQMISFETQIQDRFSTEVSSLVAGYNSVLVEFHRKVDVYWDEISGLLSQQVSPIEFTSTIWQIDVRYDLSHQDMTHMSVQLGMNPEDIAEIHHSKDYDVFFIGFLPGFLYLSGLDERIHMPRKATPDLHIPKGSVAIGRTQTGIYPTDSPGGWHIIGHTNHLFFDPYKSPPMQIKRGDRIRFKPT